MFSPDLQLIRTSLSIEIVKCASNFRFGWLIIGALSRAQLWAFKFVCIYRVHPKIQFSKYFVNVSLENVMAT